MINGKVLTGRNFLDFVVSFVGNSVVVGTEKEFAAVKEAVIKVFTFVNSILFVGKTFVDELLLEAAFVPLFLVIVFNLCECLHLHVLTGLTIVV